MPTFCSVFRRGPCIPEFDYPIGQDLRLTIETVPAEAATAADQGHDTTDAAERKLDSIHDMFAALRSCWVPPPAEQAQALIERVKHIHAQVQGTADDGRPYAADDPHLLTWVHGTEAYSFLQGYRRYSHIAMPAGAADRYYDEVRSIAEALGARDVPASEAQITAYFRRIRPELRFTERSRAVLDVLYRVRLPVPVAGLSRDGIGIRSRRLNSRPSQARK